MEYSKFKVEEFVTDEYFVRWIKKPDVETNAFWNSWLSKTFNRCRVFAKPERSFTWILGSTVHLKDVFWKYGNGSSYPNLNTIAELFQESRMAMARDTI